MATPDLLSSPEKVEQVLRRSGLDADLVDGALARASSAFRRATRQHITLKSADAITLDSRPGWALFLPELPVVDVVSVTVDGVVLDPDSDYEWSDKGILRRRGRWPDAYRSVDVVYDHGYDPVPDDIQWAVAEHAAIALSRRPGIVSVQLGAAGYSFDKTGITEDWAATVARYRVKPR